MASSAGGGIQDRLTLRFVDPELEARYQLAAGSESLNGFRTIAIASGVVWALAAFVLPVATDLAREVAILIGLVMSAIGFGVALLSRWALTLDRQHALASVLTAANGAVIVALALIGGVLSGYAVAAVVLLFVWGFVSRTRFVYAFIRTAAVGIAFIIAVGLYDGPANMAFDVLVFAAAAVGSLIALHALERSRRQLFYQEMVIREQSEQLADEAAKSVRLINDMLPTSIAARLLDGERTIADDYPAVSVLFGDIVGFTPLSAQLSAHDLIEMLSGLFSRFDELVADADLEKIKTIGDNYMAVGGLSGEPDHALKVARLGLAMIEEAGRHEVLGKALDLRVGVHSGPASGGVIGTRRPAFDLWGDTVNVASRLQELGPPGRVHVSEATWLLVRGQLECEPIGETQLRGHSRMLTYAIVGPALGGNT